MNDFIKFPLYKLVETFIDYRGKTPQKVNIGIPLITAKIVKRGKILPPNEFISPAEYKSWMKRGFPQKNDVILTTEAPLGEVALLKDEKVALAQRIILIRGKKKILDNQFLKFYLQSKYGQEELEIRASGTTVTGIKASELKKISVFCPNYREQKAIAAVLGSLDDKIDLLHRQNATLERMAETLFRQWFIEEAQAEWREFSVSDFVQHSKETISPQNFPSQIFYQYSIPAFDRAKSPEICLGSKILSNKFIVTENMLLISKLNPQTPRVWLITDRPPLNSVCSTEFITISPYKEENIFFLFCLFNYKPTMKTLAQVASGTSGSHQRVKPIDILSINFLSPSAEYITTFSNTASYLFKRIKSNQLQIQTLEKLRDTLLPKLMSGEVRVRVDE